MLSRPLHPCHVGAGFNSWTTAVLPILAAVRLDLSTTTNLGFRIDSDFKLEGQIRCVVKSCFYHLRRLAKVKLFLSRQHLETLIQAFISSCLDYCNGLYFGLSQSLLSRLQLVQNAAARLLTGTRKRDYITHALASLHWLSVFHRVHFKILLYVFKCLNDLAPL